MHWYIFAFVPPLLWAINNHTDKYILSRYFKTASSTVLSIFSGLIGFLIALGIFIFYHGNLFDISFLHKIIIILDGILLMVAFIPYYYALKTEDASLVAPLYQLMPIFSFILGFLVLHESIGTKQIIAGLFIILGSIFISLDLSKSKFHIKGKVLFLMLLSSFLLSSYFIIFKFIAIEESFWKTVFWGSFGSTIVSISLFSFFKKYRIQFITIFKENPLSLIFINLFNEGINIIADLSANYATLFVPVVLVNLVNGFQPLFVFLIGIILTVFFPFIGKEGMTKQLILQRIIAIIILFFGTYLLIA